MGRLGWSERACTAFLICAATAIGLPAQTFTTLVNFDGTNGANPVYVSLVQGTDGNLYGTTLLGGANGYGLVFKVTPAGTLTTLHSFSGYPMDGSAPYGGLVLGTDGNFYGTTSGEFGLQKPAVTVTPDFATTHQHADGGDINNSMCFNVSCGTIFKITSGGMLTTVHSFAGYPTDGAFPIGGPVQGTDGNFYGATVYGGANYCNGAPYGVGCGTVFKISRAGTLTTLHSFDVTDGANPAGALVQATDGNFYGTTELGGADTTLCGGLGCGTVFKITPAGTVTTLHSFDSSDGVDPLSGVVQATDGNFYGTTLHGGASDLGTVFKVTTAGTLTTLHNFDSTDGGYPYAGLVQATDGDFYGTTGAGGANGYGTVFRMTPSGTLTTLHNFDSTDGAYPYATLVQDTNGSSTGQRSVAGPAALARSSACPWAWARL
jgi:uncharacterized repeat protein (TIGR03803 family)